LINEHTVQKEHSKVKVINNLSKDDAYDLVVVLIRKNNLQPIFDHLKKSKNVSNILFLGNNVLGFKEYQKHLPKDKILFGFPGIPVSNFNDRSDNSQYF
jgi:2-dehydropantoate 2-reductase